MGFLAAFESIRGKIDVLLDEVMMGRENGGNGSGSGVGGGTNSGSGSSTTQQNRPPPTILLTGHSMGGALAQIAAAYYADLSPRLVTHLP